jgi:hypothetical protein
MKDFSVYEIKQVLINKNECVGIARMSKEELWEKLQNTLPATQSVESTIHSIKNMPSLNREDDVVDTNVVDILSLATQSVESTIHSVKNTPLLNQENDAVDTNIVDILSTATQSVESTIHSIKNTPSLKKTVQ